jgi:hypothetical protein
MKAELSWRAPVPRRRINDAGFADRGCDGAQPSMTPSMDLDFFKQNQH